MWYVMCAEAFVAFTKPFLQLVIVVIAMHGHFSVDNGTLSGMLR
jgi:hypothetical protein